jgi:hypothetical protein
MYIVKLAPGVGHTRRFLDVAGSVQVTKAGIMWCAT